MTLKELIKLGNSWYAQNEATIMVVVTEAFGSGPELIVNKKSNFNEKLKYYSEAYNEDLTLKANPGIKITSFSLHASMKDMAEKYCYIM